MEQVLDPTSEPLWTPNKWNNSNRPEKMINFNHDNSFNSSSNEWNGTTTPQKGLIYKLPQVEKVFVNPPEDSSTLSHHMKLVNLVIPYLKLPQA